MVEFLASPFFTSGRGGSTITDIVLHWMDGTLANTDAEFAHGSRRVSAHYGVEDDVVHQYVRDSDTAWHAGDWNENCRSIGIEHSAAPGRLATPATIATSVDLIVSLCRLHHITPDHIYPHKKFFATSCPGTLPVSEIVSKVHALLGGIGKPSQPQPTTHNPPAEPTSGINVNNIDLRNASHTPVTGPGVAPMQRLLRVTADGIAGPLTRFALTNYQTHAGLTSDAVFGPATASALLAGK
jgi:peptidoglycan hydrolase-like protein with peptidoglycan-binding domain